MEKTYFELYEDTTELRKTLEHAEWELQHEDKYEGDKLYEAEVDGETYYKTVYPGGTVVITDDPAVALGDCACEYEY